MNKLSKEEQRIYHKVGLNNNLRDIEVFEIMDSMHTFILNMMGSNNIKDVDSLEEFKNIKTNFVIKYFGKIYSSESLFSRRKKQSETYKLINKKRWEKND